MLAVLYHEEGYADYFHTRAFSRPGIGQEHVDEVPFAFVSDGSEALGMKGQAHVDETAVEKTEGRGIERIVEVAHGDEGTGG